MHYFEWLPIYRWIARRLNLSVAEDQRVARLLVQLVKRPASPTALAAAIAGQTVTIVGAGPSLSSIDPRWLEGTVIAADGAARFLLEQRHPPAVVVTDLDGLRVGDLSALAQASCLLVVHGHGDNFNALVRFASELSALPIIPVTQGKPSLHLFNFGGFTDGDKAVCLAEHFGANRIILVAMDFGEVIGVYSKPYFTKPQPATPRKRLKFSIAKRIIARIASRIPIYVLDIRTGALRPWSSLNH